MSATWHEVLGPGLMESACEECLCRESALRGVGVQRQLPLPVEYKGVRLDCGYRLDRTTPRLCGVPLRRSRPRWSQNLESVTL